MGTNVTHDAHTPTGACQVMAVRVERATGTSAVWENTGGGTMVATWVTAAGNVLAMTDGGAALYTPDGWSGERDAVVTGSASAPWDVVAETVAMLAAHGGAGTCAVCGAPAVDVARDANGAAVWWPVCDDADHADAIVSDGADDYGNVMGERVTLPSGSTISGETFRAMLRSGGGWRGWLDARMYVGADARWLDAVVDGVADDDDDDDDAPVSA